MRSTNFLSALLLPFLLCLAIPVLAEQTTSVISEKAAVHSRPSSSAPIAATLERGQSVVVDLMLTDSGGAWCLVRQPEHTSPAGYVLCNQLTRQAPQIYPPLRPVPSPTTPTPSGNGDDARSVTATNAPNLGGLEPWAVQLALTDDQRRTVQQLYESSGLDACRDDLAATYRRYGVTDAYSLLQRMAKYAKNPYGDSFAAAVEPRIQRGAKRYKAFWQSFWKTLTPEQQEKASHISSLFFAYIVSQSEPETPFGGSALQQIRQTQRAK